MTDIIKIDKKIVSYKVVTEDTTDDDKDKEPELETMHDGIKRPDVLIGTTIKIKTPQSEHALYVTINDVILNAGTEHEERRPYEMFVNSKCMEHFQWIVALTRVTSAVFRKGGDITFLVDELKGIFDPKGGYYKKGGVYMPSLVAEIGHAIESHMKRIGMIVVEVDEHQQAYLKAKREEFDAANNNVSTNGAIEFDELAFIAENDGGFPDNATLCRSCNVKAVIILDGCKTCLNCGDSRCG